MSIRRDRFPLRGTHLVALAACLSVTPLAAAKEGDRPDELRERAANAAAVLGQLLDAPDQGVPRELLEEAACVAVVPKVVKAGFVVAGRHGEGFVSCRMGAGWSRPSAVEITGGSIGFQAGVEATDVVLVMTSRRAVDRLFSDDLTLGASASVAAGPVGRSAEAATNATLDSEIYTYSRSKGAFAGVSLEGAELGVDEENNAVLYGPGASAQALLTTPGPSPAAVLPFTSALARLAPPRD